MSDAVRVVGAVRDGVHRVSPPLWGGGARGESCDARLFDEAPVELDDARVSVPVTPGGVALLVDFWAPWCRMMVPMFKRAAAEFEAMARLVKLNTAQNAGISRRLGIHAIPTLALFRNGRHVARISGALAAADSASWMLHNL